MISKHLRSKPTEQQLTPEQQVFDYTLLSFKTKVIVQEHANEIKSLMRRTAQDIINIGQKLIEAKEQLGHGHFEVWLRAELNWGQWTARKFMQVTRQFKTVNFTALSIDASALYLLAAPSTPEMVRQEALERAGQGEAMTHAKVKAIASRYKESTKLDASKPYTIDIPAKTVEGGASTPTKPREVAQTVKAQSAAVLELSEDKLPGKNTQAPAHFQGSNRSHDMDPAANSGDHPLQNQAQMEMQPLFEIGHYFCITDVGQQDHRWLGEVAEVKEATATEIEVVLRISLQPTTG